MSRIKDSKVQTLDFSKNEIPYPFLPIDANTCICFNLSNGKIYKNDEVISENVITSYLILCNEKLIYENQYTQSINIYDFSTDESIEYNHVDFSIKYFALTLMRFISAIYLAFLVVYLLINSLINKYKEKDFTFLKKTGIVATAIALTIFISIFFESKHVDSTINLIKSNMKVMASFFCRNFQ